MCKCACASLPVNSSFPPLVSRCPLLDLILPNLFFLQSWPDIYCSHSFWEALTSKLQNTDVAEEFISQQFILRTAFTAFVSFTHWRFMVLPPHVPQGFQLFTLLFFNSTSLPTSLSLLPVHPPPPLSLLSFFLNSSCSTPICSVRCLELQLDTHHLLFLQPPQVMSSALSAASRLLSVNRL